MRITRRSFAAALALSALTPARSFAQARDIEEPTPVRVREYSEIPDTDDLVPYTGEDIYHDIRRNPADVEGTLFDVSGTIIKRWIALEGRGYEAGYEGDVYRSLMWVETEANTDMCLASNDDLADLKGARTFRASGSFGGLFDLRSGGGIRTMPLVLIDEIERGGVR